MANTTHFYFPDDDDPIFATELVVYSPIQPRSKVDAADRVEDDAEELPPPTDDELEGGAR